MRKILTYGTFDLFHIGHLNILEKAKSLGDYLLVGVSTDEFNLTSKGKKSKIKFEDRKRIVEALRCVDEVIPEVSWNQKVEDIKKHEIDVFVIGDDWTGKFDFLKEVGVEVVYLSRTPGISSTDLKNEIRQGI